VTADPTDEVDGLKVARNLPQTLTPSEVEALLAAPTRRRTPEAKRDRAMLELLYATGMRVSELIALNIDDVNLMDESVRCVGRNRRERVFPLPKRAFEALEEYIHNARPLLVRDLAERALFVSRRGGAPHPPGVLAHREGLRPGGQNHPSHHAPHVPAHLRRPHPPEWRRH